MGAVSVDVNANSRKFDVLFPMNTREGVETFLENYNHLKEMVYYAGDYDALIMIIDFEMAFEDSRLTNMERRVINLVFVEDYKRVDVAKMLDVTKQTVQKWLERGLDKLANYYEEVGVYDEAI